MANRNRDVKTSNRTQEIKKNIIYFSTLSPKEALSHFNNDLNGLSKERAAEKLEKYGSNEIKQSYKDTVWQRLFEAIVNPFNIILLIIAGITLLTDVILVSDKDYYTFIVLIILIGVSSGISFIQSETSSRAVENLTSEINNTSHVYRDGELIEIVTEDIVPGDIIKLGAGDMIPADLRFLKTKDCFISQSSLTGESEPVEKFSHSLENAENLPLSDLDNVALLGSTMISGSALAIAFSTGNYTYLSTIANLLTEKPSKNSFEQGVEEISRLLIRLMLLIVPIVFLINAFNKGDMFKALLFSISIAVGLTPEMLPVITSSTLAIGARKMSKKKVIVRNMSSIQSLGQMNILCTDKTGTLTEDEIVLEKYMDLEGNTDLRVLRHAYLNSYFQTGLKNLIDVAIINKGNSYDLDKVLSKYKAVDEIPFDFNRRRMSVVLEDKSGKRQLITKGAVEEMLSISRFIEMDGKVQELSPELKKRFLNTYEKYNRAGLRMLAVAQKNDVPDTNEFNVEDESEMVLIGLMGFLDPPKESASPAIEALKEHKIRTVVLTGDSTGVAKKVCNEVGIDASVYYEGIEIDKMNDSELKHACSRANLFTKLSPQEKKRIIETYQDLGNTVGYLGDGVNDSPALKTADVGISVDSAVDIAKETADIVLMEKDLMVLEEGVEEGRKTYTNIMKYINMASSGNFGNIISIIIASIFLPFLPMKPVQLLTQNILNDFAQLGMPYDNVDDEYLLEPKAWSTKNIKRFIFWFGPISTIFDVLCFVVLWFALGADSVANAGLFQSGWFLFGTLSQIAIIHMIRTAKTPFLESNASKRLTVSTLVVSIVACVIAFSDIAIALDMRPLPLKFLPYLILLLLGYCITVQVLKKVYVKKYGEWM